MRILLILILFLSSLSFGQSRPEDGGHEIEFWTGGGHSVPGGTSNTNVWSVGGRYGWILTRPHGPGFLNGRFEYAVDVVPIFVAFQGINRFEPADTAYGAGFNPLNLKWEFASRGRVAPYFELSGGVLFTNRDVPAGTNSVNFTPSAALGTHLLGEKYNWSLELRYLHVSNSGLAVPNPGLNTVQLRVGVGRFFKH
jgi:hypothetical protein